MIPRDFMIKTIYSAEGDFFREWIKIRVEEKKEEIIICQKECININPRNI